MPVDEFDFTGALCVVPISAKRTVQPDDDFFPTRGSAQVEARNAKEICNHGGADRAPCPRREPCLEYAISRHIRFGVWGGKSERERARIQRLRRAAETAPVEAPQRELIVVTEVLVQTTIITVTAASARRRAEAAAYRVRPDRLALRRREIARYQQSVLRLREFRSPVHAENRSSTGVAA